MCVMVIGLKLLGQSHAVSVWQYPQTMAAFENTFEVRAVFQLLWQTLSRQQDHGQKKAGCGFERAF